jgi:hypothetical protein
VRENSHHGNNIAISLSKDIAEKTRKVNEPATTNTGSGAPPIDIVAYEYKP